MPKGSLTRQVGRSFTGSRTLHGVRLDLRANGFVFTNRRSLLHVKASSIDRRLAKTALEARLGTFVAADYEQGSEKQEYQKRPRFARVDTSRLWEEYQAQRELHKTLRQAKLVSLAARRALQIDGVKAAARAKRSVIKMTLNGAGRRIAYVAVQNELRQGIRAVNARIREERRTLGRDTRQLSWVDWLQQQASSGRSDALEALRVARGGDHFQKTAYSLLVGCILHLCYKAKVEGTPATFGALDRMLADTRRPILELWNEMLTYAHINGQNHPVVAASPRDMLDRPPNEAGSVLSTAKTFLDLYRDPTVAKNTSRSDFRIRDLMHYTDPVSLYIITQPNDKDRLRPLVRIVVNMIVRLLADKMEFENGRPKPTYKHKLLAMIDEFPALGKLEMLQQSLAFVAGYGIKCYLIAQDINQLKSRETGYGPDESITSNCYIQAAFPSNRLETAEHLSKLTGTTTIIKEQVTRSVRGFLGTQVSTTMQEVQRPLLPPDECQRMPGPQKDEHDRITAAGDMVIYCAGHPAIYGRQPLYFQDKTFATRAAIPAPTQSDSLSSLPAPVVQIA